MKEPRFSPMAVEDLNGILEYIARDNPGAAIPFVDMLKDKCHTLGRYPLLGASREQLAEGLRVFSVGKYAIYYRPESETVRVERVLHGARDVDSLFGSDVP